MELYTRQVLLANVTWNWYSNKYMLEISDVRGVTELTWSGMYPNLFVRTASWLIAIPSQDLEGLPLERNFVLECDNTVDVNTISLAGSGPSVAGYCDLKMRDLLVKYIDTEVVTSLTDRAFNPKFEAQVDFVRTLFTWLDKARLKCRI